MLKPLPPGTGSPPSPDSSSSTTYLVKLPSCSRAAPAEAQALPRGGAEAPSHRLKPLRPPPRPLAPPPRPPEKGCPVRPPHRGGPTPPLPDMTLCDPPSDTCRTRVGGGVAGGPPLPIPRAGKRGGRTQLVKNLNPPSHGRIDGAFEWGIGVGLMRDCPVFPPHKTQASTGTTLPRSRRRFYGDPPPGEAASLPH